MECWHFRKPLLKYFFCKLVVRSILFALGLGDIDLKLYHNVAWYFRGHDINDDMSL